MTLVAEAAEGTLSDVAADENFIVEPDVVRAYVSAVAAVSASPEETTKAAAATGVEIVAPGYSGRRRARPTPLRRPRRRRRRVGRRDDRRRRRGKSLRATERDVGRHGRRRVGASDDDRVARRRVGQKAKKSSSSGGCESVLGRGQRDDVERDASASADAVRAPDARVVVDPLVALALDATTAVATATTRGRSANETAGTFVKTVVATRGRGFSRRMSRRDCAP